MEEKEFLKEIELIKEDVSEFEIRYSPCQYFHERAKYFSGDQLKRAVDLFNHTIEEKFHKKDG